MCLQHNAIDLLNVCLKFRISVYSSEFMLFYPFLPLERIALVAHMLLFNRQDHDATALLLLFGD